MALPVRVDGANHLLASLPRQREVHARKRTLHRMGEAPAVGQNVEVFLGLNHVCQGDFCSGQTGIKTFGDGAAKFAFCIRCASHKEDLVFLMKIHDPLGRPTLAPCKAPPVVEVDACEEMFGLIGIVEPAFLDDRNLGVQRHENHGKDTDTVP